jgi:hypothetical protein
VEIWRCCRCRRAWRRVSGALATSTIFGGGRLGPGDDVAVIDTILRNSPITGGVVGKPSRRRGRSDRGRGNDERHRSKSNQAALSRRRAYVEGKQPWPTLTARRFIDTVVPQADEALPGGSRFRARIVH